MPASPSFAARFLGLSRPRRTVWLAPFALALGGSLTHAQPVECAFPGNQLVNCGFDTDLSGWSLASGDFVHQPGDGFPQPGSLEVASVLAGGQAVFLFEQAVPSLPPTVTYALGVDARLIAGTVDWCTLRVTFAGVLQADITFYPTAEWSRVEHMATPSGQAPSANFAVTCSNFSGQPFRLRVDDALLQPITWGSNVGVGLQSCAGHVALGGGAQYGAVVRNQGPEAADVDVVAALPGTCHWTCDPGPGAFCTTGPVQASLADAAYIPSGGSVTYEAGCLDLVGGHAVISATVVGGYDPDLSDNTGHSYQGTVPFDTRPSVKGDLTGDLQADLLLRHAPDWAHVVWRQVGSRRLGEALAISPAPSAPWLLEGADDFDDDRQSDLVFRDPSSGAVQFWLMNGVARRGEPVPIGNAPALAPEWRIAATGDFDRDGQPDLVWRNGASQKIAIWTMNGSDRAGVLVPSPDQAVHANWEIVAALDYDDQNDGVLDLLWYNSTSGRIVLWLMDAQVVRRAGFFTNPPAAGDNNWKVLASADYGLGPGGGHCTYDLVWRNANSGKLVLWYMDHAGNRTSGAFTSPAAVSPDPTSWTVTGPR